MTVPEGAQVSEDGNYWWDGNDWQQVGAGTGSQSAGGDSGDSATEPVDVGYSVSLVAQPTESSCWAASIAMLVNETPQRVVESAGMSLDEGYGWDQIEPAAHQWGLSELAPASGPPSVLASWLQENGPLWVVERGAPYHAVVVGGISGDGSMDGTYVTVYNPWPVGSGATQYPSFREFEQEFELGAGSMAAILYK
jgi:hypothetical protein